MKTTLNLNDRMLQEAKGRAPQQGITLTKFVADALCTKLMAADRARPFKLKMRTISGIRPPNVDISDREALYDVMDRG